MATAPARSAFDAMRNDSSMNSCCKPSWHFRLLCPVAAALLCFAGVSGCHSGRGAHSLDPRLRKVDEMLSANIREGMSRVQVLHFLKSRGYQFEDQPDMASLRVLVRHVDAETLQPTIARATFHFNAQDRLASYELQPAPDAPFQP
jgi:hypothetical protein